MIILSSVAFAAIPLQCDEQDVACNGAENIAGLINNTYGGELIRESAGKKRHRTSTIRKQLQVIVNHADRGGCVIESFVGLDIDPPNDAFDGSWSNGETGGITGDLVFEGTNKGTLFGSYDAFDTTRFFGDDGEGAFGVFEDYKLVADWDTGEGPGFMAGKYMRAYGNHFVGWGAVGYCNGGHAEALDGWYPGDLSPFFTGGGSDDICSTEPGDPDCDGVCFPPLDFPGPDCNGVCNPGEGGAPECDGSCSVGEDESSDCDGTCEFFDDNPGPDCDGQCGGLDEAGTSECDGVCSAGDEFPDCDGVCDGGESGPDCDGTCDAGEQASPDCNGICDGADTGFPDCNFICEPPETGFPDCDGNCNPFAEQGSEDCPTLP